MPEHITVRLQTLGLRGRCQRAKREGAERKEAAVTSLERPFQATPLKEVPPDMPLQPPRESILTGWNHFPEINRQAKVTTTGA